MNGWRRSLATMLDAEAPGSMIEQTPGNHLVIRLPNGARVYASLTPSCRRSIRHVRAQVRRSSRVNARG
jgi:predicted secreted protein